MTNDDSRKGGPQGGLPQDAGNEMSDRSTWADDSASGQLETPIATGDPGDTANTGVPATSGGAAGTTFGTGGDDQGM